MDRSFPAFPIQGAPYDYYRFTKYGLRYLGESNGFIVEHIAPHGGVFQVIARILNTIPIKLFFQSGYLYYIYIIVATIPIIILNSLCYLLDFLDVEKTMTLNFYIVSILLLIYLISDSYSYRNASQCLET